MIKPVWIGRFQVSGARDHRLLNGYPAAYLWVASQTGAADTLKTRVAASLSSNGLTVVSSDRLESIVDDTALAYELRKLIRDARRNPDSVACGKFQGFEDHAGLRPNMLQVKTERLLLRPWEPRDRAPFAAMNADREVMTFSGPMSRAESDEAVDRYLDNFHRFGFSFLVAEERATNAFAGIIGLQIMRDVIANLPQPAIEVGWRLGRAHQGRGLATEGGRAILKLAFEDFQLPEVVAITAVANRASRRVAEKLGMHHRANLDFDHPRLPPNHLYKRHTLYQLRKPSDR